MPMLFYCTDLKGKDKVDINYLLLTLAPNIASNWKNVATQLGITNVNKFAPFVDLTEERFGRMLQFWLYNNKTKRLDEIFLTFEEALRNIKLNTSAGEFSAKYKEYLEHSKIPN